MPNYRFVAAVLTAFVAVLPAQEKAPSTAGAKPADAAAPGKGLTIGVVDLDKARDAYPRAITEREKLQKMSMAFKEQIDAEKKHIDALRAELALLKPGTDEWEAKEAERGLAMERGKVLSNVYQSQFNRAREKYDLMIYQDFEVAIAQVAKDRGVQIVLRMHEQPEIDKDMETADAQQARLYSYNRRNVWFAADEVDLTPALIKFLQVPLDASKRAPAKTEAPAASKPTGNGAP